MGSLPHISVAGATATATHGSGDGNGILSTSVRGLEIITADGNLRTIANDDPDLAALAVGMGAFGVITNITLAIQPSYLVRQDVYTGAPWGTVLESFDEVMASAYSVNVLGNYGRPDIGAIIVKSVVTSAEPTEAPKHRFGGVWDDDAADGPDDHRTIRAGIPGPWSERLPHFRPDHPPSVGGDELQSEYFVPRGHGVAAIEALLRMGERIGPHLHASEIRTMAGDELWASPAYGRDSVSIGFTWRKHPDDVASLTRHIEAALEPFDPRPHWGKLFAMRDLRRRLPKLVDFFELAERFDPRGKFRSEFLDSIH